MNKSLFLLLSFCCSLVLSSCGINVIDIEPRPVFVHPPLIDPYPLRIGFYHGDRFKEHHITPPDVVEYNFALAEPSAKLTDTVLKAMFRDVIPVDGKSAPPKNLDGTIIVDIDEYKSPLVNDGLTLNQAVIVYQFMLFDHNDKPIGILRVTGKGTSNKNLLLFATLRDAVELAMKDAMAQFMLGFAKHPRFKLWLGQHGVHTEETETGIYAK